MVIRYIEFANGQNVLRYPNGLLKATVEASGFRDPAKGILFVRGIR